jgi:hypothetical protein
MTDIPVVIGTQGAQPTSPATLLAALIAAVTAVDPGYTANLPGSLIEDISSTDVAALSICDSARVEAINSMTPYAANAFLLLQLGQIYLGPGAAPAVPTNTSVYVTFTGTVGFIIGVGFIVSDGTYQYVVQDGGIIPTSGSVEMFCLASISGSWAVPTGTVTQNITSVPGGVTLSCSNTVAGVPGAAAETEESFRSRVLIAGQAVAQGMPTLLRTLLGQVSGVQPRLISIIQGTGGWEIIVGGGDPYQVANAIFMALFDISILVGSSLDVTAITNANPGVMTTNLNHGYTSGQVINVTGVVGMSGINSTPLTITVITEKTFSLGINTTSSGAYVSGGVVTPNLRNITVDINDYPNTYAITFVNPPQQTVSVACTWNTIATNFVSSAAVAQLAIPAIVDYINSIPVGAPINLIVLEGVFTAAVVTILQAAQISVCSFAISINGVGTSPTGGTQLVYGDPESYFETSAASVSVVQS